MGENRIDVRYDGAVESSPLLSGRGNAAKPRPTFSHVLREGVQSIFPDATAKSVIAPISMVQYVMYIASVCVYRTGSFLPSPDSLVLFGALKPWMVQEGHVWQLVTAMFLHVNWIHLVFSVFFQLRTGFSLEKRIGLVRTSLFYFLCGVFGNIIHCLVFFHGTIAVGSSVPVFGLLGWEIVSLAFQGLDHPRFEMTVINLICYPALMLLLLASYNGVFVPQVGQVGALCCGMAFALVFFRDAPIGFKARRACFWIGLLLLIVMWIVVPVIFFAVRK